jgi:predicted nucleic acid-binding protein
LWQFHAGEAAALVLAQDKGWWLLIHAQRALTCARQRGLKGVTVPECIVYRYQVYLRSYPSALTTLDELAPNTGQRVMQAAQHTFLALAQRRGGR